MRLVAIALLAACGGAEPPPVQQPPPQPASPAGQATCADVEKHLVITVTALAGSGRQPLDSDERAELARFLHDLSSHCVTDSWSAPTIRCFATTTTAGGFDDCLRGLSSQQSAALDTIQKLQPRKRGLDGVARHAVQQYAFEAYPMWAAAHPDQACPTTLAELREYTSDKDDNDPWGHPYKMMCGPSLPAGVHGVAIASAGPDGMFDTADDIRSW
jgi:hypothetical protein